MIIGLSITIGALLGALLMYLVLTNISKEYQEAMKQKAERHEEMSSLLDKRIKESIQLNERLQAQARKLGMMKCYHCDHVGVPVKSAITKRLVCENCKSFILEGDQYD